MLKPNDFSKIYPWNSIAQKSEVESWAMFIMEKLGDKWPGSEYGNDIHGDMEKTGLNRNCSSDVYWFERIAKYFRSEDTARLFSPAWEKAGK